MNHAEAIDATPPETRQYVRATVLPVSQKEAFAWHERDGAFERLTPPFMPAAAASRQGPPLAVGTEVVLRLVPRAGRLSPRWRARHVSYDPPRMFADQQVSGPFTAWLHRHRFEADGASKCVLIDEVTYRLPFGRFGTAAGGAIVETMLDRMFAYRHRTTVADLTAHCEATRRGARPMHIAITGSSGMIGTALGAFLSTGGHQVSRVVRRSPGEGEIQWDPDEGVLDPRALAGVDAVVHLAGESIASRRWSQTQRRRLIDSREKSTRLLAETIAGMDDGPKTLICASGINYYGDRGDEELREDSGPGRSFLTEVCIRWEEAAAPAVEAGVRVANLRTGIVLSPTGGALAKQLPLFRLGVGGKLGSGQQWMSWISLDDIVGAYHHALTNPEVSGPVNAVSPQPVSNATFTDTLATVLGRPAVVPVPKFAPKAVLGDMADELLFSSMRVIPAGLAATDYTFRHPGLEGCLRDILGRPASPQAA